MVFVQLLVLMVIQQQRRLALFIPLSKDKESRWSNLVS